MKPKHQIPINKPEPAGWRRVGKVKEPQALKGELSILLFAKEAGWVKHLKEIALEHEEGLRTYKVQAAKMRMERMVIALEGIPDRTAAEKLLGLGFLIPAALMISKKGETLYLHELLNFRVCDQGQEIGRIEGFSSNGPQDLLIVVGAAGRGEIPFVEAFIEKIDFPEKTLWMNLPQGLFPEGSLE